MSKKVLLKTSSHELAFSSWESPVGTLFLLCSNLGLHAVLFDLEINALNKELLKLGENRSADHFLLSKTKDQSDATRADCFLEQTKLELGEYFNGLRKTFTVPTIIAGTPFQMEVWAELKTIPYGQTICYQEQAIRLGDIKKCRAVGTANSLNPIAIIVPCHRVIAKSGQLSGYGGGVERKRYLLNLEAVA